MAVRRRSLMHKATKKLLQIQAILIGIRQRQAILHGGGWLRSFMEMARNTKRF